MPTTGTGSNQISVSSGQVILQTGSGTGQLDFTSGVVKANATQLLGTAWLTPGTAGTPDVNAKLLGGTAQTGRDVGASVLLSAGTGTGQLDFTSGVVKANLAQILGTALTETAGLIAAAFKKFFNVATPTGTVNSLPAAAPQAAGGLITSAAGSLDADDLAEDVDAIETAVGALPTALQNADALLNRDMSAVSDTNARSPLNALRFLRNKRGTAAGTLTVTKEDDSTSAWTAALTTDAAAVPVITVDPA